MADDQCWYAHFSAPWGKVLQGYGECSLRMQLWRLPTGHAGGDVQQIRLMISMVIRFKLVEEYWIRWLASN